MKQRDPLKRDECTRERTEEDEQQAAGGKDGQQAAGGWKGRRDKDLIEGERFCKREERL